MSKELSPFENGEITEVTETRILRRVSVKNTFQAFLDAFNLERGLIYTIKSLFLSPGSMVRDYLSYGRFHYIGPFKLLVLTTAISLLLLQYSLSYKQFAEGFSVGADDPEILDTINYVMFNYYNLILWVYIPISAFFTWLFNRKSGFNYAENLVMNSFFFCATNILSLIILADRIISPEWSLSIYFLGFMVYAFWLYKDFFSKKLLRSMGEMVVIITLSMVIYFFALTGIFVAVIFLVKDVF